MGAEIEGSPMFQVAGTVYDSFMGRYSGPLATPFAEAAGVRTGQTALDVGCGPGALTSRLAELLGPANVTACDPSAPFVSACAERNPGVEVRLARAEALPFVDSSFDAALAQLVLHFVAEPEQAIFEFRRVVRPGGTVAACVWDFSDGMEMLRRFWEAVRVVDPEAPEEARSLRFGAPGELAALLADGGLEQVVESTIQVSSVYLDFDELWNGFLAGVGPAGAFCVAMADEPRERVRDELYLGLGRPSGSFELTAVARCATARVPA